MKKRSGIREGEAGLSGREKSSRIGVCIKVHMAAKWPQGGERSSLTKTETLLVSDVRTAHGQSEEGGGRDRENLGGERTGTAQNSAQGKVETWY